MRAAAGLWRWRGNPVRRATDLVEAWVALVAALLIVSAAPVIGWITGGLTEESMRQQARAQRQQRLQITATVLGPAPESSTRMYLPGVPASQERRSVIAAWTAADGSRHTGRLASPLARPRAGDTFTVWADRSGRITGRPLDASSVRTQGVLAGVGAALASAGLTEGARRLLVRQLVRRRHARLDRAWAAAGPDWGRAGAGS
ncbi:hypothetical protein ACFYT4_14380 [Streptomyces sp. NPDC004609]|uniref:Rv1733c family protein n=1 Tax=Streptomyces sp. NPDC004609 TaxID=3364704 RepID=UPI0036BCAE20